MFKKVAAVAAVVALSASVAFAGEFTVSNQLPPSHHISKCIHFFADKVGYMPSYWIIIAGLAYILFFAVAGSKVAKRA